MFRAARAKARKGFQRAVALYRIDGEVDVRKKAAVKDAEAVVLRLTELHDYFDGIVVQIDTGGGR